MSDSQSDSRYQAIGRDWKRLEALGDSPKILFAIRWIQEAPRETAPREANWGARFEIR